MTRLDEILTIFRDMGKLPLSQWSDRFPSGRFPTHRPLAIMNTYVPQELCHAAGYTPVLLMHRRQGRGLAQRHLPGFTCWVVRSALDQALARELSGWAGVVFAHTCDAVQALADLWPRAVPDVPSFYFAMPHHLEAPASHRYLLAELRRLQKHLEEMAGRALDPHSLRESIRLYNTTRLLVARLYEMADRLPPPALHATLRSALLMPREAYNPLLAELLEQLPSAERTKQAGPRLIVAGPELADPTLYEVIADAGGSVVGDLLDLGHRHFSPAVSEEGDPLEALADHMLALLPTPTKYHPQKRRDTALVGMAQERCADGVIFARQKFCEPHGFDIVPLRAALDKAGLPHLLIELEQTPSVGQMRTRVEAFLEMIAA